MVKRLRSRRKALVCRYRKPYAVVYKIAVLKLTLEDIFIKIYSGNAVEIIAVSTVMYIRIKYAAEIFGARSRVENYNPREFNAQFCVHRVRKSDILAYVRRSVSHLSNYFGFDNPIDSQTATGSCNGCNSRTLF